MTAPADERWWTDTFWSRYLVMMQKSLADFRQSLRQHANEGDSDKAPRDNTGQWLDHEDSDSDTDIRGKWQTGSGSEVSSSGNGSTMDDIRGVWHYSGSKGSDDSDVKQDSARLERIFPRLTMLITKRIAGDWNPDRPQLHSHISLFKPVTTSQLMFASVNGVYCRDTTFCGAVIHEAYNPMNRGRIMQEQVTGLSFVSDGQIFPARPSAWKRLHRQLEAMPFGKPQELDVAFDMKPNLQLSVKHFTENMQPAGRSEALYETTENLLDVISVCPISIVDRLKLEIQGLDADDLDTLTPLVSQRYWLTTLPALIH
jgi:hypothetical protein